MFDVKYPSTFHLRKGAGRGDPANGLCFMETAAYIMGEPITDHPECACPVLTSYGIFLNDSMPDDARQRLLPLAVAVAGTRSPDHMKRRVEILGRGAVRIARNVQPPNPDARVSAALDAADAYWNAPSADTAYAAYAAAAAAAANVAAAYAAYAAYAANAAAAAAAAANAAYAYAAPSR